MIGSNHLEMIRIDLNDDFLIRELDQGNPAASKGKE